MSEPIKTDIAFELLRTDILSGRFVPDQPLRVAELSERYGVSATPLREALSRLAEKQLVVAAANRGWRVAPVSLAEFEDIARARLAVESALLADAIACGGLDWESGIVGAHYRLGQTPVPLGSADTLQNRQYWIAAHDAFHCALLDAARSAWLKGFYRQTAEQLQRHHQAVLFHGTTRHEPAAMQEILQVALSVPRHTTLMEMVLDRDRDAALTELEAHIEMTLEIYRQIIEAQKETANPARNTTERTNA
ncbi:MAG: GntR family transcriptional regulator [Pararhodobacter sp.]|nr:GntR family transcriptional regulator [Pararhodobacter sp.]